MAERPVLKFSENNKKLIIQNAVRPETLALPASEFLEGSYRWSASDKGWAHPKTFHTALLLATLYRPLVATDVKEWIDGVRHQRDVPEHVLGAGQVWPLLRHYQKEGTTFLSGHPTALLADSVGLGKTIQAIAAASTLPSGRLVVCPNSLKDWWASQIMEYCPHHGVLVCGQGRDAVPDLDSPRDWTIVHWEAIRSPQNLRRLRKVYWSVIIADEAHRIKNVKTQTAKALKRLRARQRWALTATPYANLPADMFSILQWLRPDVYASYWKFYALYTNYFPTEWGRDAIGPKNEKTLAWELQDIMLRRESQSVFSEVPPTTTTILPVSLEGEQRSSYSLVRKEALLTLEDGSEMTIPNAVARTVRLRQVAVDPSLIGLPGGSAKLRAVETLLEMSPEPVVIFTTFRVTAEKIAEHLTRSAGRAASLYVGGSPYVEIAAFQEGLTDTLVGTIAAMREGLNLQRARRAIFVDLPWSQIEWVQASGRIRPGLERSTEIIIIEARNTIDRVVRYTLEGKLEGAKAVYDALKVSLSV